MKLYAIFFVFCGNLKMPNVILDYSLGVKSAEDETPLLIIGNIKLLELVKYDDVKIKLPSFVNKETYNLALTSLRLNPSDKYSLYLNLVYLAGIPDNVSHYNCSSQPHLLTEIVKSVAKGRNQTIVIVCEKKDIFPLGCAVAKAFPTFSRKTMIQDARNINNNDDNLFVHVEFLIMKNSKVVSVCNGTAKDLMNYDVDLIKIDETLASVGYGIQLTARIIDTPCNEMNVDHFIEEIKVVGKRLNIIPVIIRGEELKNRGFGGIYGVGQGAAVPPALVVLSHIVPTATQTIAWVGKGIVYDTGGLCIKGRTAMPGMKRDCGGAAAILGAFYASIKQGFIQNLHAVFCLAENAVGPLATKPDDIHKLYSGKTVEINNTDAEGRLVLADGVAYAQINLKANIIIDMATLTGAQSVSTGKFHAAVMSNARAWEQLTVKSGLVCGDLAFPIPYCPELHFNEFTSDLADMKNSVADRSNALSSCAGLFIGAHLGFDTDIKWIHIDIAGVSYSGERATGYGVALLTIMFGIFSKDLHLQYLTPYNEVINANCDSPPPKKMKIDFS